MYVVISFGLVFILCPVNNLRDPEAIALFGRHLRQMRQQRGLTMEELADQSGVSYNQLGRIELGEINTTISTVFALARGLQVRPAALFDFDQPAQPLHL